VIFQVTNSFVYSGAMVMSAAAKPAAMFAAIKLRGHVHHVTVPDHKSLRLGTLGAILSDVANYLQMERSKLEQELFNP
jgi:hypothetical protein